MVRFWRKWSILLGVLALSGILAAPAYAPSSPAAQVGRAVTDETGRHMTIPANVRRIVSLAPNLTEIVYALGVGDRLAGDTNLCDVPTEAKFKPHVGNPQNPSLEAVVALHPDVVLATGSINTQETADTLLKLGIPVYTTYPRTVRDTLDSIAEIADVIGAKEQGDSLKKSLRARLDALQARLADQPLAHVFFLVQGDPPVSIGQNTFIADALRWAGAESVLVTGQDWPSPSFEEILRLQPDYIAGMETDLAELRNNTEWQGLIAVRLGRVVAVSDEFEKPSPGLVDAIEKLAHQLHPEAFAQGAPQ